MLNRPLGKQFSPKEQIAFQKRIESVQKEEIKLYKKAKIERTLFVNFPNKKRVPLLAKLASYILAKCGGILDIQYRDIKK